MTLLEQSFVLRFEFPAHPTYNFRQSRGVSSIDGGVGALSKSEVDGDVSYQVASMEMLHELASLTTNFGKLSACCVLVSLLLR